jgi:hypothetical protein
MHKLHCSSRSGSRQSTHACMHATSTDLASHLKEGAIRLSDQQRCYLVIAAAAAAISVKLAEVT